MIVPEDLKYTKTHEWIKIEGDIAKVGITDYAQEELGEVVHVELPDVGNYLEWSSNMGIIESIKSVSELYAPLSGKVVKVNQELLKDPLLVNNDPYGKGWLLDLKIDLNDTHHEFDHLIDSEEYENQLDKYGK